MKYIFTIIFSLVVFASNAEENRTVSELAPEDELQKKSNIETSKELDNLLNEVDVKEEVPNLTAKSGDYIKANSAVLQILNKISTRKEIIELEAGSSMTFDNYYVKADVCWSKPADQISDDAALIEFAATENDEMKKLYHGWLFSSSPSLSSVKHPIYDLKLLKCR